MKKSSKVKFYGVAAAALLAVAPAALAPVSAVSASAAPTVTDGGSVVDNDAAVATTTFPDVVVPSMTKINGDYIAQLIGANWVFYGNADGTSLNKGPAKANLYMGGNTPIVMLNPDGTRTRPFFKISASIANPDYSSDTYAFVPVNSYFQKDYEYSKDTILAPAESALLPVNDKSANLASNTFTGFSSSVSNNSIIFGQRKASSDVIAGILAEVQNGTARPVAHYTAQSTFSDSGNSGIGQWVNTVFKANSFFGIIYQGHLYFISDNGSSVVTKNADTSTTAQTGVVTTTVDNAPAFTDSIFDTPTGKSVAKSGTTLKYDQISKNKAGAVTGYHISADTSNGDVANSWLNASTVKATEDYVYTENATGKLTAKNDAKVYTDAALTKEDTSRGVSKGDTFEYTQVVKNGNTGDVLGYGRQNNGKYEYVKAADFDKATEPTAPATKVTALPTGTALYSNFKGATIYSDQDATKDSGSKLNTSYDEWSAFDVSKDSDGHIVAYRLGKDQWVKASDLSTEKALSGTFDTGAGVALYNADGTLTGTIQADGQYTVFGVKYIDGKQSLKLGTDAQWVHASDGDYYPA
ncbi:MAG: hypothetical protein LKF36_10400 [Lactobacillus sp.]|nr:hypothetical protein [Lactobacillus sp.]